MFKKTNWQDIFQVKWSNYDVTMATEVDVSFIIFNKNQIITTLIRPLTCSPKVALRN